MTQSQLIGWLSHKPTISFTYLTNAKSIISFIDEYSVSALKQSIVPWMSLKL